MKAMSINEIFGLSFVMITILVLGINLHSDAFSQENKKKYDMVLLSQNYNSKAPADEIVGVILNNGTATARSVEISAIFFDDRGRTVGHESGGTSPSTISPGDKSEFALQILDEAIKSNGTSYDFTVKWQDEHSFSYFTKSTGGEIADNSEGNDADGDDGDDDEDN